MQISRKILPKFALEIVERKQNMASLELLKINKNKTRENGHVILNQKMEGLESLRDGGKGSKYFFFFFFFSFINLHLAYAIFNINII